MNLLNTHLLLLAEMQGRDIYTYITVKYIQECVYIYILFPQTYVCAYMGMNERGKSCMCVCVNDYVRCDATLLARLHVSLSL